MSKATVVRTNQELPNLEAASKLLFGALDGMSDGCRKVWRKIWRRIINLEPGEIVNVEMVIPRNPRFHRKFFALLQVGFEAWEPGRKHKSHKGQPITKNFEQFREDITILAGYYEQTFDLAGRMRLRAKSISFSSMDDAEFEVVYSAVADTLLEKVLTTYAGRDDLDEVVDKVIGFL